MTISLYGSAFTDAVTSVSAGFLNWVRTSLVKAIDGTAGGTYAPSATITVGGEGITMTGDLILGTAGQVRYRVDTDTTATGAATIDDDDDITVFTSATTGGVTATLPAGSAAIDGVIKRIVSVTTNTQTITVSDPNGPTTVIELGADDMVEVYYSNARTGWYVSSYYGTPGGAGIRT